MYDNTIKDKFVELRAAGKSFGDISQELGVVKSTLHRWEDERADDIARLRRIAWEETEAEIGLRLEEQLSGLACDIKDFQTTLDRVNRNKLSVRETLMLLRESRREYFRLRNMLMGAASRPRSARKISPASAQGEPRENIETSNVQSEIPSSPPSLLPSSEIPSETKSNTRAPRAGARGVRRSRKPQAECLGKARVKTERSNEIAETRSRNTNDLQQSAPRSFDSCRPAPPSGTSLNSQPSSPVAPPSPSGCGTKSSAHRHSIPTRIEGEGQTGSCHPAQSSDLNQPENPAKTLPLPCQNSGGHNSDLSPIAKQDGSARVETQSEIELEGESIPFSPYESTREWLERQGIMVSKIPKGARIISAG